jgi:hypothetical protein
LERSEVYERKQGAIGTTDFTGFHRLWEKEEKAFVLGPMSNVQGSMSVF